MNRPIGTLQQASTTEDRILFVYRRDRKTLRGVLYLLLTPLLVAGGFLLGYRLHSFLGWMLAILPLFAGGVAANWGLADLLRPTLFELEVDHRARTLALSMGQRLAKVRMGEVTGIEITEKEGAWNVTIQLGEGRKIGLGLAATLAGAEATASRFSELLGVRVTRL